MSFDHEVELVDPRAMRALAHPVRLALLDHLREEGAATATEVAAVVGESPSSCSYHLRTLARWGFVEQAAARDARERRWRIRIRSYQWRSDHPAGVELERQMLARSDAALADYLARRESVEPEWTGAASMSFSSPRLTADELEQLGRDYLKLLKRYTRRRKAPPDARRVHITFRAFPR